MPLYDTEFLCVKELEGFSSEHMLSLHLKAIYLHSSYLKGRDENVYNEVNA